MSDVGGNVSFFLNGALKEMKTCSLDQTLIQFLREEGLTGTKMACGEGSCGSCTVLVTRLHYANGQPEAERIVVNACTTLLVSLHGAEITTVEGLGTSQSGNIHPIQERLYSCHGTQCGFCSPGMVMAMAGVLANNEEPDIEDIVGGLKGNLCRCTGYRPIVEAFASFSKEGGLPKSKDVKVDDSKDEVASYDHSKFKPFDPNLLKVSDEMKNQLISIWKKTFHAKGEGKDWIRPRTLDECLQLAFKNPNAVFRQGGTGGYKKFVDSPKNSTIIDLAAVPELQGVITESDGISVGAGTTFTNLLAFLQKVLPQLDNDQAKSLLVLHDTVSQIGSVQLRNVATFGGTILWNHAASDITPLLLVLGARLTIAKWNEEKGAETRVVDLLADYKAGGLQSIPLRPGEILTSIRIPYLAANQFVHFAKQARREVADLAIANVAIFLEKLDGKITSARVSVGGVDLAIKACVDQRKTAAVCLNLAQKLTSSSDVNEIRAALSHDLNEKESSYRIQVLSKMVKKFLVTSVDIKAVEPVEKTKAPNLTAHQLFEKTPAEQKATDMITRPVPHVSGAQQCTGEARYLDDIPPAYNELHLYPVQGFENGARFEVDTSAIAAEIANKEIFWFAAKDVPVKNLWSIGGYDDEAIFADGKIDYHGQIIGVIGAKSKQEAKSKAALVKVSYISEDNSGTSPIVTMEEAIAKKTYFENPKSLARNQIDDKKADESKDFKIRGEVNLNGQEHMYMETHAALVLPQGENNEFIVYSTTQEPTQHQVALAAILNVPQNRIMVKSRRTGGAFGGKERLLASIQTLIAAYLTKRPCRMIWSREVDMAVTGHRHETRAVYELDYDPEDKGRINDIRFNCYINAGCSRDVSSFWAEMLMLRMDGGYTLRKFAASAGILQTGLSSNTSYRGFGGPEGCLIIEDVMERIAHQMGCDPAEVRTKNLTREGDQLHYGDARVSDDGLYRTWNECLDQSDYFKQREQVSLFNKESKASGSSMRRGIAIVPIKFYPGILVKFLNQATAYVRIYQDGSVDLSHGGIEMGQGLHTKMIQVAGKALDIPMEYIQIRETSTETANNTSVTGGSTGTDLNGQAVLIACQTIYDNLQPLRTANPDLSWPELANKAYMERVQLSAVGFYNRNNVYYDLETNSGEGFGYLTSGSAATQVEVDCDTGHHKVLRTDIVMDVGQSLNPAIDVGQIEGAFLQGYGYVAMEELLHGAKGEILTNNMSTYKIPTVADIPKVFNVTLLRNSRTKKEAVFSSKGIGEPPINLSASVACAMRQAIMTYRKDSGLEEWFALRIPLTAERVFKMCHGMPDVPENPEMFRNLV